MPCVCIFGASGLKVSFPAHELILHRLNSL